VHFFFFFANAPLTRVFSSFPISYSNWAMDNKQEVKKTVVENLLARH